MRDITIREFQDYIRSKDNRTELADRYFIKLTEEVGELAEAVRSLGGTARVVPEVGDALVKSPLVDMVAFTSKARQVRATGAESGNGDAVEDDDYE